MPSTKRRSPDSGKSPEGTGKARPEVAGVARRNYRLGDWVRVVTEGSEYFGLVGRVAEITRFNDSGVIEFTEQELQCAKRPERVLCAKHRVHFYWRELQQVIYD